MRFLVPLLGSLLLLVTVTTAILLTPEVGDVGGKPHDQFATMSSGGSGVERHENVLWLGGLFGAVTLLFLVALMGFGARKGASSRGLHGPLLVSLALSLGAWVWLLVSYTHYLRGDSETFFLALPAPSAVMLYALFPLTILFNLLYVVGFDRWVLTPKDYEDYERLLAQRGKRQVRTR